MMRPTAIEVAGFRGWSGRVELKLERPITAVVGENGRGKSSTLNALEWCLFGDAICGKTSSGIDERAGWELKPRDAGAEPTRVRVVLRTEAGEWTLTRAVAGGAKAAREDLELELPDGTILTGADAETRLRSAGAPDWETYRRAHCFHQEAARTRVLESKDRSAILASLLGLDADLELRDALEAHKPGTIVKTIDEELEALATYVEHVRGRPRREMEKIENRLASAGIARIRLSASTALEQRKALLRDAGALAAELGLKATFPEVSAGRAVLDWAHSWGSDARAEAPALEALPGLRERQQRLEAAVGRASLHDDAWAKANAELERETASGGDAQGRSAALHAAEEQRKAAQDALARADRRLTLLRCARDVLAASAGDETASANGEPFGHAAAHADPGRSEQCPVCENPAAGLLARLDDEIDTLQTAATVKLQEAVDDAERACTNAHAAMGAYARLLRDAKDAQERRDEARAELALLLDAAAGRPGSESKPDPGRRLGTDAGAGHDALAEARKELEKLGAEIGHLEALVTRRDVALERHHKGRELLAALEDWLDAAGRADAELDFEALPQWAALQAAVDDAAGFAADLEAVAEMARAAQAERSKQRETEVNQALGRYYRWIVGGEPVDVRVRTKHTGQKVAYDLVDEHDRPAVPVLNQAAINALSLALLFAQAEEQALRGAFACVVLDDPAQSLDAERQAGLATAIEALSAKCTVVLGLIPGPLVERLRDYVSTPRRLVFLGPWDAERGARIATTEDR